MSRRNLLENYRALRRIADRWDVAGSKLQLLSVVKANAYGHGALDCAQVLQTADVGWLGVTSVEEGILVRGVYPEARILVMSGIFPGEAEAVIEYGLTPVMWEDFHFKLLEAAIARRKLQGRFPVHLEIDTGMSRQGLRPAGAGDVEAAGRVAAVAARFHLASPFLLEGFMTHFSSPEVMDCPQTSRQLAELNQVKLLLAKEDGFGPRYMHAGNSATLLLGRDLPELIQSASESSASLMLRPGLALYGYLPRFYLDGAAVAVMAYDDAGVRKTALPELQPVLSWKTRINSLRMIESGDTAGYNQTFRAPRRTRLALLPLGYADGLNRLLSNRGSMLVQGRRAPIAGRISMDQTILDVTDIPGVAIGDEVVVLGRQGAKSIDAYEHADLAGTIPYEILCGISARVPRVLVD